jgi:hypothetical protein
MSMRWSRSMGWIAGAAALAVSLVGCAKKAPAPTRAEWRRDLDGALADASAHHRPILLEFYTDW